MTSVGEQHVANTTHSTETGHTQKGQGQRGHPWAGRPMGSAEAKKSPSRPCKLLDLGLYPYFYFPCVPIKILRKKPS